MSGYEKNGNPSMSASQTYGTLGDYATGRTVTDGYPMYAQNGLSESHVQAASDAAAYGSTFYPQRTSFASSRSSFDEYGMRKVPEVKSFNPTRGSQGTPVRVYIRSEYDLEVPPTLIFSLVFATRRVVASVARLETQGPAYQYCVTANAPNFIETDSPNTQIQLRLHLQESSGQEFDSVDVGHFQYISNPLGSSTQDGSRKRKLSIDSSDVSGQQGDGYLMASGAGFPYARNLQSNDPNSIQRRYSPYSRSQNRFRDIRRGTQDSSIGSPNARLSMHPPGAQGSSYNPSYSLSNSTGRSLGLDGSISSQANPTLIRTSTLQQSSPASNGAGSSSFNPYTMYPQKAVLKLRGNLNSMTENWTPEEWASKRRLVQFWRSQNKSTINAEFNAVKPEDRQPNSICISCIWWEERRNFFATSVDTIYLLEQLVALRFTVEEKNRIRRNLEGFKPSTVAKGKADSEEFFKVIMGFPNPKPRNIEKDVKVFEWQVLAQALKKIMGKYSASYSSTAGMLPQTRSSSMYVGYQSEPNADTFNRSSRSTSNSTASTYATPQTLKSNTLSPSDTSHTIPSQYSDQATVGSIPSLNTQNGSYVSPSMPNNFGSHDPTDPSHLRHHSLQYTAQSPVPGLTHSYTAPIERSRSSQGPSMTDSDLDSFRYAKRPRANTTAGPAPFSSSSPVPGGFNSLNTGNEADNVAHNASHSPGILTPSGGAAVALPPPSTPSYGTTARGFSENQPQTEYVRTGSISQMPGMTGNMGGDGGYAAMLGGGGSGAGGN